MTDPLKKYADDGYILQVGDVIEVELMGKTYGRRDVVSRVTKTLAICEENGTVKYPRVYISFHFSAIPYQRSPVKYYVLAPKQK